MIKEYTQKVERRATDVQPRYTYELKQGARKEPPRIKDEEVMSFRSLDSRPANSIYS